MTVLQEYKRGLKSVAVEEVFDLFFYRPLAFLFVKLIYNTSITPNQLTFFSMCLGILGGISYCLGTPGAFAVGAAFCLLYNVVDCSDGQLARLKKCGTPIGRILDGVADYVVSVAVYVGIGIGFAAPSANPAFYWCLTAAAGISNAIQSGLLDFYRNRYLDITLGRKSILVDEQATFETEFATLMQTKGHLLDKALIWIYLRYSTLQRSVTAGKKTNDPTVHMDPVSFGRQNRIMMHLWTYLGPTTQWTFLIVCSFLNRLDIYLWGIVCVGNVLAIIFFLAQRQKDLAVTRGRAT